MDLDYPFPKVVFTLSGHEYWWRGWLGYQLESLEWRTVPAGTVRKLFFGVGKPILEVTVFSTRREGLKIRTTWAVSDRGTHNEHVARVCELRKALNQLV